MEKEERGGGGGTYHRPHRPEAYCEGDDNHYNSANDEGRDQGELMRIIVRIVVEVVPSIARVSVAVLGVLFCGAGGGG